MILASLLFSWMGVCVRFASQTIPVSEIVFFRSIIGLVLILPVMLLQKAPFKGHRPLVLCTRGVTGFFALALYFYAVSKIPLATAVTLNYTSPLFVALLAPLILKERFHLRVFLLIVLGFLGVVLIVRPTPQMDLHGACLGLISGVFAAFAYLCIGSLRRDHGSLTIVFYFFWVATLMALPWALPVFEVPNLRESLYLLGTGVFATIAQVLMTKAYRIGTTAGASAYSSSIVLFSLLLGIIFWQEIPDLFSIVGGGLVVLSVVFISRFEKVQEVLS